MEKRIAILVTILCAASLVFVPAGFAEKQLFFESGQPLWEVQDTSIELLLPGEQVFSKTESVLFCHRREHGEHI